MLLMSKKQVSIKARIIRAIFRKKLRRKATKAEQKFLDKLVKKISQIKLKSKLA